jgi:hypothetical protein
MIKSLLQLVGGLLVAGGMVAVWMGFERMEEIHKLDAEIYMQGSQGAYGGAKGKKAAEKKIDEAEQALEAKKIERNIWFGAAAGGVVVGLAAVLLPSSRKRKASAPKKAAAENAAQPPPAQNLDAPGP